MDLTKLGMQSGEFLLQGVSISQTKTGSDMLSGSVILRDGAGATRFVCFDKGIVDLFKSTGITDILVTSGSLTVQEYNSSLSAKLEAIHSTSEEYDMSEFMESLPVKPIIAEISHSVTALMSEEGAELTKGILNHFAKRDNGLKTAMASQYNGVHDGMVGGLLNHIRKLLKYAEVAMGEYSVASTMTAYERDLVVLGLIVHDFGKMLELKNGAYADISIVPHTYLGIELLEEVRESIEDVYGAMFYRELQAIILEHHGEYGERPKTVYAYLVHAIDFLDSRVSGLQKHLDAVAEGEPATIKFDDFHLRFNRYGE